MEVAVRNLILALSFCVFSTGLVSAQQAFGTQIDASQFNKGDICLDIQAAIASLPADPTGPTPGGALIDARNFAPPSSQAFIHCGYNPFAVFGAATNPIQLVNQGTSTAACTVSAGGSAGCWGGVLLLPGFVISTDVPWLVPGNWSIIGQGGKVTVLAPSTTFNTNLASISAGTIGTNGTVTVTGSSSTGWTANVVGMVFTACSTTVCDAAATSYSSATVVGIVTKFSTGPSLTLGTPAQTTLTMSTSPLCCFYVLQAPVMAWATTCTSTIGCPGPLQNNTFGSVIQDVGLNCVVNAGGGTSSVSGCIPFWDEYGQERSQLKRVSIAGFVGPGIGIYTSNAQNGGPFDDLQITSGPTAIVAGTTCVEVGGTGVGGQPSMRGIRGLTCTNVLTTSGTDGIGVDINTQNFSLSDAHFEDYNLGVEIGDLASARGIWLSDITGGNSLGTVVDINVNCYTNSSTCGSFATSDINVSNVFKSTSMTTFTDNISNNTATEATLGFYSLGDGSGSATAPPNTRPIVTTSSTLGSRPNLLGMAIGTPITGVQGSTGTLVQMSSGSAFTIGDLLQSDSHSNTADSGILAANIANTVEFFTNAFGLSTNNSLINTTIKLWGFSLPNAIDTGAIVLDLTTTDNSANFYSLGIYNSSGTLAVGVGPIAGSTLFGSGTGSKSISWSSSATLSPGKYYFATATSCASACAVLGGTTTGTFASAASGGTSSGGALPNTIPPPTDSWAIGAVPSFTIH
jgi:hypothetical protein